MRPTMANFGPLGARNHSSLLKLAYNSTIRILLAFESISEKLTPARADTAVY